MNWPKLVLASASPRRAELLRQVGADFLIRIPRVDEAAKGRPGPEALSVMLARRKARAVRESLRGRHRERVVLAADTVVSYRHHLLGKPENGSEAARMLGLLSGRTHRVTTGLCLIGPDGRTITGCQTSLVKFRRLTPGMIRRYIASGEPGDKAGAYGIQGRGALLVARVEGCYFNIVGLPLAMLDRMLARL